MTRRLDAWHLIPPFFQYLRVAALPRHARRTPWRRRIGRRSLAHRAYKDLPRRGRYARAARRWGPPPPPEAANMARFHWYMRASYWDAVPRFYEAWPSIVDLLTKGASR